MGTTISSVRAAIHTLFDGDSGALADVQVSFGEPAAYEEQEVVGLRGITQGDELFAALGGGQRNEVFGVIVSIKVEDPAGDADTVDARGWVLYERCRELVKADMTLGNLIQWAIVTLPQSDGAMPRLTPTGAQEGWDIFIDFTVAIRARIT